jgi:hypothetical protein
VIDKTGPFTPVTIGQLGEPEENRRVPRKSPICCRRFGAKSVVPRRNNNVPKAHTPTFDLVKSFRMDNVWPDLLAQFGSEAGCRRYVIRLGCAPSGGVDTAAISSRKKKSRSRGLR